MKEIETMKNCWYRTSIKALVLNETRDKFLITKEENGMWELPGGGLDWGETPQSDLPREIAEEMGLEIEWVAEHPSYFYTFPFRADFYGSNLLYEIKLKNLDFTPSDECVDIAFINKDNAEKYDLFPNVPLLLKQFNPSRHQQK